MEPPPALGGVIPAPASQSARKEWRAMPDHSYRSNAPEEHEYAKLGQSAERTKHEVGTGPQDVDFCSIMIDGSVEINDEVLEQKLQEISRQREELQQMEIELRARAIARSEILELQNSFKVQLKEHIEMKNKLKEQVHEREQRILELERKLEEKDRELHAMQIDTEAVWAKEDLLREQNKELASFRINLKQSLRQCLLNMIGSHQFSKRLEQMLSSQLHVELYLALAKIHRRERDNSEVERAQHLNQIHELQEHIQEKENQSIALQEQHQVAQETILFKDEQLREAQSWIARVQEMDALQSSTNQSLQAELRERTEQFNQYWIGFQRQFVEMERHHMQSIQQLQLELAEARDKNGTYTDGVQVTQEKSTNSSSHNGNHVNVKDGSKSNGHMQFTSNAASIEGSSFVSTSNSSSKTELAPAVPIVPSSIIGLNGFIPPGQMASLHPYVMNPVRFPHAVASTNSPIPQSHVERYQQMPVIQNHLHWQNQQFLSDFSHPTQSKNPSPTAQDILGSDSNNSFNLPGEIQIIHQEHLTSMKDKQQISGPLDNVESAEVQSMATQQRQGTFDPCHVDSAREDDPQEKEVKAEDIVPPGNQSEEQLLKSVQKWPTSSALPAGQNSVSSNGTTAESTIIPALVSSSSMPTKQSAELNLLDERSLLACIVRAVPAGPDSRIRISTTLPNRLGKMLAPLHWHDYKKKYGKLDDFVACHPELFVIEADFIYLREGAQQIISATAAFAKVASATASSSASYVSLLPSVAVTPVAQLNRQKVTQSIEPKSASSMPYAEGPATNAGNSNDKPTQILPRQDEQPSVVRFNIIQGLSDGTISNTLKNVPEADGLPSEFKSGHSTLHFTAGNAASLDRPSFPASQNKGLRNGRHSFGGKQQGRSSGAGFVSRR